MQTSGGRLSYLVDPQDFFIQPGKRYLLVLSYNADGDFYTLVKNWELSGGVVNANSKLEQIRAAQGKASLAGVARSSGCVGAAGVVGGTLGDPAPRRDHHRALRFPIRVPYLIK